VTGAVWHVGLAGLFLLATHFGMAEPAVRGRLVARLGEGPYRGLYSLVSAVALVWLVLAYAAAPHVWVWPPDGVLDWVPVLVMPVAVILVVAGLSTPNPSAVGQDRNLAAGSARGILRVTRNPFMWGVGLWAVAHGLATGHAAALLLFGTIAVLAFVGAVRIDRKLRLRHGADWDAYAAVTSNVPFAAILTGRQHFVFSEIRLARIVVALAIYVVLIALHPYVMGTPALPPRF